MADPSRPRACLWRVMTLERKFSTKKGAANGTTDLTKKLGFSREIKNVRKGGIKRKRYGLYVCMKLYCWYLEI